MKTLLSLAVAAGIVAGVASTRLSPAPRPAVQVGSANGLTRQFAAQPPGIVESGNAMPVPTGYHSATGGGSPELFGRPTARPINHRSPK
jgi:hypothetical protein